MTRPLAQSYRCGPLRELARQLHFAPAPRKTQQVFRAEQLHDEIDPDAMYPSAYLAYRITRYRLEHDDDSLLVGAAVRDDLRLLIDQLSRSLDLPPRDGETIATLDQWAAQLHVSRKTLERWRKTGLRWRWFIAHEGAGKQIGLTAAAVERFRAAEGRRVARAARFSALSADERGHLIEQARAIKQARPDLSLHRTALRLAGESGRSVETIRQLLAAQAADLFPDRRAPLTEREHRLIARAAGRGVAVRKLAERLGKSRPTLHRAIQLHRAEQAGRRTLRHVQLVTFQRQDADEVLLGHAPPTAPDGPIPAVATEDLAGEIGGLYRQAGYAPPTLRSMFVRYNYLKFRADRIRAAMDRLHPRAGDLDRFESLADQADTLRDRLVAANLSVVLSVVRRHLIAQTPAPARLIHLLILGHAELFEAIEAYDPSRSHTFETYLHNRLLRRLAGESESDGSRAQRRIDGAQMLDLLRQQATAHGVRLFRQDAEA